MKCHYEVLGISTEATDDEIKKAYRKLALYWHPDKNLDRIEECTKQFHLIQQAYDILTDPQERAWYDKHRDAILRGGQGQGEHYKDDGVDVYQYFNTCCYSGYADDEEGFYAVYRGVFETITEQDHEFVDDEDFEDPGFGDSQSSYEQVVGPFYAFWESYCTAKSYVWEEQHDTRQAPNRLVRRAMEQENKKLRDKARKERNEEVRALTAFVKKRDRRVKAYKEKLEQRALEITQLTEKKKQKQRKERLEAMEDYKETDWSAMSELQKDLEQLEANVAQEFGEKCKLQDSDEEDEEEEMYDDDLFCVACNKLFKTEKAFANHEKSKKHKENVLLLRTLLEEEEEEVVGEESGGEDLGAGGLHDKEGSDGSDLDMLSEEEELSEPEPTPKSKKSKKQKKRQKQQQKLHNLSQLGEETQPTDAGPGINGSADSVNSIDAGSRDAVDEKTEETAKVAAQSSEGDVNPPMQSSETAILSGDADRLCEETSNRDNLTGNTEEATRNEPTSQETGTTVGEGEKTNSNIKKPSATQVKSTVPQLCNVCHKRFPTRNKLFDHIKSTGHALRKEPAEVLTANDDGGKKRKKKKGKK